MTPVKAAFDFGETAAASGAEATVIDLFLHGNLPLAEIEARRMFSDREYHAKAFNLLGCIAVECSLMHKAEDFFRTASDIAPDWLPPKSNLSAVVDACKPKTVPSELSAQRVLLIKSWGVGFWSDVSHVIGQALLAELTNRTPIVHWGANCLFSDGRADNAFDAYFEPVSDLTVDTIWPLMADVWPPKWTKDNLFGAEVNKWEGPFSRLAGLYLLGREEGLLVSDFFTSVFDLTLWIPREDPKYSMTFSSLYTYLVRKYLRPKREITDLAAAFRKKHLPEGAFVSVHARGSDKIGEQPGLDLLNLQYHEVIEMFRRKCNAPTIFLMTDDARLLDDYVKRYGRDVVFMDCERTSTSQGVHYSPGIDPRQLGVEVMVDAYVAIQGAAFVGNGSSNPSQMVRYLGTWPDERVRLLGDNMYQRQEPVLHQP